MHLIIPKPSPPPWTMEKIVFHETTVFLFVPSAKKVGDYWKEPVPSANAFLFK